MADQQTIFDVTLQHQIGLQQYANEETRTLRSVLDEYDSALFAALLAALLSLPPTASPAQLDAAIFTALQQNDAAYAAVAGRYQADLPGLVDTEAEFSAGLVAAATDGQQTTPASSTDLVGAAAAAWAAAVLIQGSTFNEQAANLSNLRAKAVRDAVRVGWVNAESPAAIVAKLRGTISAKYSDGVFETHRGYLEALIRTAVTTVTEAVRDRVFDANPSAFRAVVWLSVLDSRTTPMCQARSGKLYTADSAHRPLGHSNAWGAGPGALHWNCRSTSAPVVAGEVPRESYGTWLGRQPASFQDQVLGPSRGRLFRTGGYSLDRFVNDAGRRLTLSQLRAQDTRAFAAAGIV